MGTELSHFLLFSLKYISTKEVFPAAPTKLDSPVFDQSLPCLSSMAVIIHLIWSMSLALCPHPAMG